MWYDITMHTFGIQKHPKILLRWWPSEGNISWWSKIEKMDNQEIMEFSKTLVKDFLSVKTRNEASESLKKARTDLSKLSVEKQKEFSKKIDILEKWLNDKGLFNSSGNIINPVSNEIQKQISDSLGIKEWKKSTDNQKETLTLENFKKNNPIEKYKNEVLEHCLSYPKKTEWGDYLKEKKSQISTIGIQALPEYNAVIETLLNLTKSKIFDEMTGFFSKIWRKIEGRGSEVKEFEIKAKKMLDTAIQRKEPVDMSYFEEKRWLTPIEQKIVDDYMKIVKLDISKLDTKEAKLKRIKEYIKSADDNTNKSSANIIAIISNQLASELYRINESTDGGLLNIAKNAIKSQLGKKDTEENRKKAESIAIQKEKETKQIHFVYFDTKTDQYEIKSIKEISNIIANDIMDINRWLFRSILDNPNWKNFFSLNMSEEAISAVWAYALKRPNTSLFIENPGAKDFFIQSYNKTIAEQTWNMNEALKEELQGDYKTLFPTLSNIPAIDQTMFETLKKWKIDIFYDLLISKDGMTNGKIRTIMSAVKIDTKNLKDKSMKELLGNSKEFKWKKIQDFTELFNLDTPEKKKKFESIQKKPIVKGILTKEEKSFLLNTIIDKKHPLYLILESFVTIEISAKIEAAASHIIQTNKSKPDNQKPSPLTSNDKISIENAGKMGIAIANEKVNTNLSNQNSDIVGIEKFNTISSIWKELNRLRNIKNPSQQEIDAIDILKRRLEDIKDTSVWVSNYVKSPWVKQEHIIGVIRDITWTKASEKEIKKWIETQRYISKYVTEKDFVDAVEKNAANMNLGETKSIQDLYNNSGKVDISNMSKDNWSIKLSDTNVLWSNSLNWIDELLNCRIEVCRWNPLNRTIRSAEWDIIAKNVPLEKINGTIEQLGSFYVSWLWKLAPYMKTIWNSINSVRSDHVSWLDWEYSLTENTKFLKIFAIMLYGEDNIPSDPNIPNLIKLFNSTQRENNPEYLLKKKWILWDSGSINPIVLEKNLQEASKKVA